MVKLFTIEDAQRMIEAARPVQPTNADPARLAARFNGTVVDGAGWASIDGSAPKPSELRNALTAFRRDCSVLLSLIFGRG